MEKSWGVQVVRWTFYMLPCPILYHKITSVEKESWQKKTDKTVMGTVNGLGVLTDLFKP